MIRKTVHITDVTVSFDKTAETATVNDPKTLANR